MIDNDKIEVTWTSGNMFIDFFEGKFAGQTYQWPGERLADGRFWVNTNKDISQFSPQKRMTTDEERDYVVAAVHQKDVHARVVFFDD